MKQNEIVSKYKGKIIAKHWGGYNGRRVPDEMKTFISKHVRKTPSGNYYVAQYTDDWYRNVFGGKNDIIDFKSFISKISPYFSVSRIQLL